MSRRPPNPRPDAPTLAARVRSLETLSWNQARAFCRDGKVRVDGEVQTDDTLRVPVDAVVEIDHSARKPRKGTLDPARLVHVDGDVVVVDKPPGMLTVPYDDGDKDTLVQQTQAALRRRQRGGRVGVELSVVHRLDKETSGLLVFARNLRAKRALDQQFRAHTTYRRYLALAHGHAASETHESYLISNRGDGLRGSFGVYRRPTSKRPKEARRAVTHTLQLEGLAGASLVACRLETGRQHQIRIHLAEAGHPLLGERVYIRELETEPLPAPRVMLHAGALGFAHPRDERPMRFERAAPEDFVSVYRARGGRETGPLLPPER